MIQTVLSIDYGKKRVGIAIGNTLTQHAEPLEIIANTSDADVVTRIVQLVRIWQVSALVLGMPTHPDGSAHEMTQACLEFQSLLAAHTTQPIALVDERFSSAVLPNTTRKRGNGKTQAIAQDDKAAALLLQQYFDEHPR